jgi:hypothetical protein
MSQPWAGAELVLPSELVDRHTQPSKKVTLVSYTLIDPKNVKVLDAVAVPMRSGDNGPAETADGLPSAASLGKASWAHHQYFPATITPGETWEVVYGAEATGPKEASVNGAIIKVKAGGSTWKLKSPLYLTLPPKGKTCA